MLSITASTRKLVKELDMAIPLIERMANAMMQCSDSKAESIGGFITRGELDSFVVMKRDADSLKNLIRRVCTGEISLKDGTKQVLQAEKELSCIRRNIHDDMMKKEYDALN